jgi:hypothetical protein
MMTVFMFLWLLADPNAERRARIAIDAAVVAERSAEVAYAKPDLDEVKTDLKNMADDMEKARQAFIESGRTPGRNPRPYKYAEQRSRELLVRLNDLEQRMDSTEHEIVDPPKMKVQAIHDEWFEGIMGKKK